MFTGEQMFRFILKLRETVRLILFLDNYQGSRHLDITLLRFILSNQLLCFFVILESVLPTESNATTVMTIRSVKILLVCNTDFFAKLAKIGQYLVSILGKSQYI